MKAGDVRPAAVAGLFYPGDAAALRGTVADLLARAPAPPPGAPWPRALIAPHAGYVYSGPVAATAYRRTPPAHRVALLGPAHRVYLRGMALPGARALATPLGVVEVDAAGAAAARALGVIDAPAAHADEHSLEVHLPFLQQILGDFTVIPIVVGDAPAPEVARVIEALAADDTVVVISSDLSHYLPYAAAVRRDRATADRILALDQELAGDDACGCAPLNGLAQAARTLGWRPALLDLRNSGDTAGDTARVVGYAAFALEPA